MTTPRYTIVQHLADLDFDRLYIARSEFRGGLVILRVLSEQATGYLPDGVARLLEIGAALRPLQHPHIKSLIDADHFEGQPALIYPYFDAESVDDRRRRGEVMAVDRVVRTALDMSAALYAGHMAGVVHGGIRPTSALITRSGSTLLSEWGSIYLLNPAWRRSPFIAPELREGDQPPDTRSDLWSLGNIMCYMLTLRSIDEDGFSLREAVPAAPPVLLDLIERLTSHDRFSRPVCASQVGRVLESLRPLAERVHFQHLPRTLHIWPPATPVLGRDGELRELAALLADPLARLIGVVGETGTGKTTLATEAASRIGTMPPQPHTWRPEHSYLVRFIPDSRPDRLMMMLSHADGVPFSHMLDYVQQAIDFLRERVALLLLDDIEHFELAEVFIRRVLSETRAVKVVFTSTTPLGLVEEHLVRVGGLAAYGLHAPAMHLFEYVVGRANPERRLSAAQREEVAVLCRRMGGAPLSIVLAGGAASALDIPQLLADISEALNVYGTTELSSGRIRSMFEFVWLTLSPSDRDILMRLSVLQGEISPMAAHALCGATLVQLRRLAHAGMLALLPDEGAFVMHPLVRRYAQEWLAGSPDAKAIWRDHALYALGVLQREGRQRLFSPNQAEAARIITAHLDDIRAAWMWLLEHRRFDMLAESAEALYGFLVFTLRFDEDDLWFGVAVHVLGQQAFSPEHEALMAAMLLYRSILSRYDMRPADALRFLEAADQRDRSAWPLQTQLHALEARGLYEAFFGSPAKAQAVLEQMQTLALYQQDHTSEMIATLWLGACIHFRNTPDRLGLERGKALLRRALEIADGHGDRFSASVVALHMGINYATGKDPTSAVVWFERGVEYAQSVGNHRTAGTLLVYLAEMLVALGRYDEARHAIERLLAVSRQQGHPWVMGTGIGKLVQLEAMIGNYEAALQASHTVLRYLKDPRAGHERSIAYALHAFVQASLGQTEVALQTLALALAEPETPKTSEVWVWRVVLTHWLNGPQAALPLAEATIERFGTALLPHHCAILYVTLNRAAVFAGDREAARTYAQRMMDELHKVVSIDYRGSALVNILDPRLYCTMTYVDWLLWEAKGKPKDDAEAEVEEARLRAYEAVNYALQLGSPIMMMYALMMAALVVAEAHPQQATAWVGLILQHPKASAILRQSAQRVLDGMAQRLPPRLIQTAGERGRYVGEVADALREIRTLL
jgi:serine/threonine protein kinase/tetratricopeptide (TPR) repeat protein